jgi:hypothetical protein
VSVIHHYRVFGLAVASEIELSDLEPVAAHAAPDVVITRGTIDAAGAGDHVPLPITNGSILRIDEVATFAITAGTRIVVDALADVPARNVRLYLLGSAMGMLLHQRGLLPLHANAVEIDGRAFAFMGRSGAGKSTLAAWFHDAGHRVLSDDVCVVRFAADGRPLASAGLPRLRLWRDAVERSGREPGHLPRSYSGDESFEKYDLGVAADAHGSGDLELAAVYLLGEGAAPAITRLGGLASVEALFANTYRGAFVADTAGHRVHWQACVDLAGRVPIFGLQRQWGEERIAAGNAAVLAHASGLGTRNA